LHDLLIRITKAAKSSEKRSGITYIVIRRPYAYLEKELRSTFKEQEDVKIIVDRRISERPNIQQAVKLERRRSDRRRPKEQIIEVVIRT